MREVINQKLKNNKKEKRKTYLFKQQEILKEELNEVVGVGTKQQINQQKSETRQRLPQIKTKQKQKQKEKQ